MPYVMGLLIGFLAQAIGSFVPRVLLALGLSYVTYQGLDIFMDQIKGLAMNTGGLPPYAVGFLGMIKLGTSINILLSAVSAKYAILGLSGAVTRLQVK